MKTRAPQFDLPGQAEVFNLAGEILIQAAPSKPKVCGKALFFMPPCVLPKGHAGDCQDGFGGHYHHEDSKPETKKEKAE